MSETLKERVRAFELLALPGQPRMMHIGTANLVSDLWREVQRLGEQVKTLMNQSEECVVITGKVTYPNDIGQHPADCQCTACWRRRAYL
jgi:hypothetical protein